MQTAGSRRGHAMDLLDEAAVMIMSGLALTVKSVGRVPRTYTIEGNPSASRANEAYYLQMPSGRQHSSRPRDLLEYLVRHEIGIRQQIAESIEAWRKQKR